MSERGTTNEEYGDPGAVGRIVRGFLEHIAGERRDDRFPDDDRFLKWSYGSSEERGELIDEFLEDRSDPTDAATYARELLLASTFVEVRYFLNNPGPKTRLCMWIGG